MTIQYQVRHYLPNYSELWMDYGDGADVVYTYTKATHRVTAPARDALTFDAPTDYVEAVTRVLEWADELHVEFKTDHGTYSVDFDLKRERKTSGNDRYKISGSVNGTVIGAQYKISQNKVVVDARDSIDMGWRSWVEMVDAHKWLADRVKAGDS